MSYPPGQKSKKEHESSTAPSNTARSTPAVTEAAANRFTWIDEKQTSSASGGRRGVRRAARDHNLVRAHAAKVSSATRLATIRKRSAPSEASSPTQTVYRLNQRFSVFSQGSTQNGSSQATDPPPWYVLRLLGEQGWYQDAIQSNSVNQKS